MAHDPYGAPILWDIFTCWRTGVEADGTYTGLIPRGFECHMHDVWVKVYGCGSPGAGGGMLQKKVVKPSGPEPAKALKKKDEKKA